MNNFTKLLNLANKFKTSKGFYSRLFESLINLNTDEINAINNNESLKHCHDELDLIMFLEGC